MFADILKDESLLWFIVTLFPSNINMICVNHTLGTLWLGQFQECFSPRAFVILFWKSCKCPMVGAGRFIQNPNMELKTRLQMPYPGATPVIKLQMPSL